MTDAHIKIDHKDNRTHKGLVIGDMRAAPGTFLFWNFFQSLSLENELKGENLLSILKTIYFPKYLKYA